MIDFEHTDEQALVIDMARGFAARELRPTQRDHETIGVSAAAHRAATAAGLGELWPAADPVSRTFAIEELALGDAGATLALVGQALTAFVAGRLALPPSLDLTTTSGWAVHVHDDPRPDAISWLPVRSGADDARARILQLDRAGRWRVVVVRVEPIAALGLHAAGAARCVVVDTVAAGDAGPDLGGRAVAELRIAIAAMCVGVARASLEYASAYVQERVAFGKRLADHQGVGFIVADMALAVAAARVLVHKAAMEAETAPAGAAHAFVEAASAALFATDRGVQLLGGHGYLKDHPVEKWMRDARCLALLAGGRDLASEDSERDAWERRWT